MSSDQSQQEKRRQSLFAVQDARTQQTRRKLVDALHGVLADAPETLSVATVAERAGVGRSTFYTHFATVDELAVYAIDRVFAELAPIDAARRLSRELDQAAITKLGLAELLDRVADVLVLVTAGSTQWTIQNRLVALMADSLRDTLLAERPGAGEDFLRLGGEYIAGGVLRIFIGWLTDPRGLSRKDLLDIAFELLPDWLSGRR